MSSGLVATMGLPAQAVSRNAAGPEVAAPPATAPIAVQPAVAFASGLIAAPDFSATAAPLSAPAAARVSFENSAFKAVPKVAVMHSSEGQSTVPARLASSFGSARGSSVVSIASRYIGVPYVYGGTTLSGWDCSGAVGYIFRQIGVHLPRTANEQMLATTRISSSEARAGDLVFFVSGGRAYHVGIVGAKGMMYDAQRTGKSFTYRAIYSSSVVYGRVSH